MAKKPDEDKEYKIIHGIADRKAPIYSAIFIDTFKDFIRGIKVEDIKVLVDLGAFDAITHGIPWHNLRPLMRESLEPEIFRTIIEAADKSSANLKASVSAAIGTKVDFAFDKTNPRIKRYLESELGTLITEMSRDSQKTIAQMVTRAQVNETSASRLTRDIKGNIALRRDQETALSNFENSLFGNKEIKPAQRTKMVNDYRGRLLGQRATLIARTETMRAANFGFMEGFLQASEEGLIDKNGSKKEWIVTPDDRLCPTCKPMNGVQVPLEGKWRVTIYTESKKRGKQAKGVKLVRIPNEIHPNCRCAMKVHPVKPRGLS